MSQVEKGHEGNTLTALDGANLGHGFALLLKGSSSRSQQELLLIPIISFEHYTI